MDVPPQYDQIKAFEQLCEIAEGATDHVVVFDADPILIKGRRGDYDRRLEPQSPTCLGRLRRRAFGHAASERGCSRTRHRATASQLASVTSTAAVWAAHDSGRHSSP